MIYVNGVQDDSIAVSQSVGDSAVIQEIEIDCFDGHSFSLETGAVSNGVIEFRQEDEVSWHDIESSPYDLSSFAGTRETFQIRFTPSSAAPTQELKFKVGP